jgi:predicted metal-dependent phosphoesterase TrpH
LKTFLFHIHTEESYDSCIKIMKLLDFLVENKIDYFCVTDHHNMRGCNKIEKLLEDEKYKGKLRLVRGVEITTEYGDVIPCFIHKEIKSRRFDDVVKETKEQHGLIIIPHPFVRHSNLDYLAKNADGIEIFNAASPKYKNKKASDFSQKYPHLMKIAAVDAHCPNELKNALNEIDLSNKIRITPILSKSNTLHFVKLMHAKNVILNLPKTIMRTIISDNKI